MKPAGDRKPVGENGGRTEIRTQEGVSQQIYSLPPLATWVSYQTVALQRLDDGRAFNFARQSRPRLRAAQMIYERPNRPKPPKLGKVIFQLSREGR